MAYNLRTGLTGSGDIDINVSLDNLDAANITSGQFGDARISDLNATKLTGTLSADRINDGSLPKSKINEGTTWAETEIPTLPKTKIQSGANTGQWDVDDIPSLPTSKITSGSAFPSSFIPSLNLLAGQVTSSQLNLTASDIPALDADKITSGRIDNARLPANVDLGTGDLSCADLTSTGIFSPNTIAGFTLTGSMNAGYFVLSPTANTLEGYGSVLSINGYNGNITCANVDLNGNDIVDAGEIRFNAGTGNKITGDSTYKTDVTYCDFRSSTNEFSLDASKITSGTLNASRLPTGIIAYKAVTASGAGLNQNQIGSNYEVIDSNLQMAFVVPASALVEIELTFCAQAVNAESVLARLVYGGTSYEYASYASLVSPSTNNTLVIYKQDSNSLDVSVTTKWVLQFPSSAIGYGSGNIDAQVKTGGSTQSFTIKWGTGTSSTTQYYPPVIFKATALPSTADLHIYDSAGGQ
jgi:hypothetical protein